MARMERSDGNSGGPYWFLVVWCDGKGFSVQQKRRRKDNGVGVGYTHSTRRTGLESQGWLESTAKAARRVAEPDARHDCRLHVPVVITGHGEGEYGHA